MKVNTKRTRRGARWSNVSASEVADVMHGISQNPMAWDSASWRPKTGLWGMVVQCFYGKQEPRDRMFLRNWYQKVHSTLKACFLETLGIPTVTIPPPMRESTPAQDRELHCICNGSATGDMVACDRCDRWFHCLCVRQDVGKLRKQPTYMCPSCEGNNYIRFPSICLESIVGPIMDISYIHGPGETNNDFESASNSLDSSIVNHDVSLRSGSISANGIYNTESGGACISNILTGPTVVVESPALSDSDEDMNDFQHPASKMSLVETSKPKVQEKGSVASYSVPSIMPKRQSDLEKSDPASWLHASYLDCDTYVKVTTFTETVDIPKTFSFTLPKSLFKSYVAQKTLKSGALKKVMRKGWLCRIRDQFKQFNRCCVFNFRGQDVLQGRFDKVYDATGYCSQGKCWKNIKVFGYKQQNEDIKFTVICKGTIEHQPFSQLKSKDLDNNHIVDLIKRIERRPALSSYVRGLSVLPLSVTLFTDEQLQILKALYDTKHDIVLHIDATGGIVQNHFKYLADSQILLYAIVIENPKLRSGPIAVAEFLSNSQDTDAISTGISRFYHSVTSYLKMPVTKWLKRVETDYSLATISAVIQNCWPRMTLKMYLNMCWEEVFQIRPPSSINLHVCRSHNTRTLHNRIDKCYNKNEYVKPALVTLLRKFLFANDVHKISYYISKLFRLCCYKKFSGTVQEDLQTVGASAPRQYGTDFPIPFKNYVSTNLQSETTMQGTSFGKFFCDMLECTRKDAVENDKDSCLPDNPFFNQEFTDYMVKYILPFVPLHTHIMFSIRNDTTLKDDQSPVEIWNNIIKEGGRHDKLKLSRYVEQAVDFINGKCKLYMADLIYQLGLQSNVNVNRRKRRIPNFSDLKSLSAEETYIKDEIPSFEFQEQWKKPGCPVARRSFSASRLQTLPFIEWGTFASDTADYMSYLRCKQTKANRFGFFPFVPSIHCQNQPFNDMEWDEFDLAVNPLNFCFAGYTERRHCYQCGAVEHERYNISLNIVATINAGLARLNTQDSCKDFRCRTCSNPLQPTYHPPLEGPSPFFVFHLTGEVWKQDSQVHTTTLIEDLPTRICIVGQEYSLFACSLYQQQRNHFVSVIMFQGNWYTYDGMERSRWKYPAWVCAFACSLVLLMDTVMESVRVLPVVVGSPIDLIKLLESFLGYKSLDWTFKIPKNIMLVTQISDHGDYIDLLYDDISSAAGVENQDKTCKIWIPKAQFRKTDQGRIARGEYRRRKRQQCSKKANAVVGKVDGQRPSSPTNPGLIVGAIKDLQLEFVDLETATGTSWLNGFVIDFFATCLVEKVKPYGISCMPSAAFWCTNGEFQFSDFVVTKFCGGVSLATERIVTVANFGNHWVLLVADRNSTVVSIADTLRGNCLTRDKLQSGVNKFGEILDRAFKRSVYTRSTWSYRFFEGVENQSDTHSCGPASLYFLEKVLRRTPVECCNCSCYAKYRTEIIKTCLRTTE
ncbi:unnamed protein product, partial [Allacma fusca]